MAHIETNVNGIKYDTDKQLFVIFHNDEALDALSVEELTNLLGFYIKHLRETVNEKINSSS